MSGAAGGVEGVTNSRSGRKDNNNNSPARRMLNEYHKLIHMSWYRHDWRLWMVDIKIYGQWEKLAIDSHSQQLSRVGRLALYTLKRSTRKEEEEEKEGEGKGWHTTQIKGLREELKEGNTKEMKTENERTLMRKREDDELHKGRISEEREIERTKWRRKGK